MVQNRSPWSYAANSGGDGLYGLKEETMYTVYGLAEATLAVTFPMPGVPASGIRVSRKHLGAGQHVLVDASADHVEFANLGKPVSHCSVRIANEKGAELQEGGDRLCAHKGRRRYQRLL